MLARVCSNKNSHSLLMGVQNGTTTLEESLTTSHKAKHNLTLCLILGIYPIELKTCPHKNLHKRVYTSFIHNCQNLEATKCSFIIGEWINKLVHPYNEILFSDREMSTNHEKTCRKSKCILLSERNQF